MHDPFAWSIPLGRLFGITIRVHWLFPFVALGFVLHAAFGKGGDGQFYPAGTWIDAVILIVILFGVVLLHEFGHCFGARHVNGEAQEILMWPLGGLANVELPNRPRAHFITAAAGPAVNFLICIVCVVLLQFVYKERLQPPWNPMPGGFPARQNDSVVLSNWAGEEVKNIPVYSATAWVARTFWVSYFLFLLNVVLAGFPLDGGKMLQAALWPWVGYRTATLTAVFVGLFGVVTIVGLYAIVVNSVLALCLALFVLMTCRNQWILLETGGEEGLFGYDFSQGYTSLERDQPAAAPPVRKVSWWRAWLQRRAARRMQRETEEREAEERRLDELLDKVHRLGQASLSDEERRFMKRVSDRYRKSR
jgi:Zn-dependent protease